jgi:hypothetical protein
MTDEEINGVVSELLRKRFAEVGFDHSTVESEEAFEGSSILRVTAHFNKKDVPSRRLVETIHDIRSDLIRRGEERFVILSPAFPHDQDELVDEDLE